MGFKVIQAGCKEGKRSKPTHLGDQLDGGSSGPDNRHALSFDRII